MTSRNPGLVVLLATMGLAACGGESSDSTSVSSGGTGGTTGAGGTGGGSNVVLQPVDTGECLPRQLALDESGRPTCLLLEVVPINASCSCTGAARRALPGRYSSAARSHLVANELCDGSTGVDCETSWCACEIVPAGTTLGGSILEEAHAACRGDATVGPDLHGWCYIGPPDTVPPGPDGTPDPAALAAQQALVAECGPNGRKIRLVGEAQVSSVARTLLACG